MTGVAGPATRNLAEEGSEEKLGNGSSRTGLSIQLAGFQGEGISEGTNRADFATKDASRPGPAA